MPVHYYDAQELCNAIYYAVKNSATPLSRLEISRAIGRRKTPHILVMIESLVEKGYFERMVHTNKLGRETFVYRAIK